MANNQDKKRVNPKVPQKPNYQIWIIVALVGLIFAVTFFNRSNSTVEIGQPRFEDMVESKDVEKITIIKNQDIVEVYLKSDALQNAKYRTELENRGPFASADGPQYKFQLMDASSFMNRLRSLEDSTNQSIPYQIEERHDVMSFLFNWGFLILILIGFWFLMRRMTGSTGRFRQGPALVRPTKGLRYIDATNDQSHRENPIDPGKGFPADYLFLNHTSFFIDYKQQEYKKLTGIQLPHYNLSIMLGSFYHEALDKVDHVIYFLNELYPEPRQIRSNRKNNFLLEELATGEFVLAAQIFLNGNPMPLILTRYITLSKEAPKSPR